MSTEDPRPGTTAAVDRRVERVEEQISGLDKRLALVELEQKHSRELQQQGFATTNANLAALAAEVRALAAHQSQSAAEAKVREGQSVSNARLFAMAASAATIAGVLFTVAVSVLRV